MGANDRRVHKVNLPIESVLMIRFRLHGCQETIPHAHLGPAVEPAGDGRVLAVALGHVAPGRAGTEYPADAVDDGAVIKVGSAGSRFLRRQVGFDARPLGVGEVSSGHYLRCLLKKDDALRLWYH